MRNKWFAPVLLIVVMLCICWTSALADEERETFTSEDYEYALLDDGTVEITKHLGYNKTFFNSNTLFVPDTLDGKKVTTIGNSAFAWSSLRSITIPNSVTSIGDSAFDGCFSLTSITLPDSVISIGDYAFNGCFALASITIPDSVVSIGDCAFKHCTSLTSITIPDSVVQIGATPFALCDELKSISVSSDQPVFCHN